MTGSNEQIVRRTIEVINSSESVDEVMEALEPLMDPEMEWVNPQDAIERGTRKGEAGMRKVLENFIAGAGGGATSEIMQAEERGDRVFILARLHARGSASGAEALGPPVGMIYSLRDGRVFRIEWHYDVDKARANFDQAE